MKPTVKACTAALALVAMSGETLAGSTCARTEDTMAMRTAAIQQQLMVAALYCQDVGLYNRFVISYQRELQDSDAALMKYFRRANASSGEADYHAYKTRLANGFSLAGLHAMQAFCETAKVTFDTALNVGSRTLAALVSVLPDARGNDRLDCTLEAAVVPAAATVAATPAAPSDGQTRVTQN